jgi:hypothetical protein
MLLFTTPLADGTGPDFAPIGGQAPEPIAAGPIAGNDLVIIDDGQVPLGSLPDFGGGIIFPEAENVTVAAGSTSITLELRNPEGNPCWFVFEISLTDSNEVLYTSAQIAPGPHVASIELPAPLLPGEHPAVLDIRAYSLDGFSVIEGGSSAFIIIAH